MGSAIDLDDIKRFELTEVYAHPDAKVDIVLVHGLNGDPRKTWTSEKGTFWPTELLPVTLKSAKARILVYGYNADVYAFGKGGASSDMLHQHAQTLLANLSAERQSEEATDHPIIWVVHSLGGLLLKRALNLSDDLESKYADDLRNIAVSTYGIIFLGTPHTGADPAKWGIMVEKMVSALIPKKVVHTEDQLVKTLQTNNETLQNINLKFLEIYENYRIDMVHEGLQTDLKGTKTFIVDQLQASPQLRGVVYYGIEATHSGMCKFSSKNSPGYSNVAGHIKGWVEMAPPVIHARQEAERQKRLHDLEKAKSDLQWGFHPPQAPTSAPTPGMSQPNQQGYHQPGLVEAPPPRTRFEFEVAEIEEMDTEMADPPSSVNNSTIMVRSTASIEPTASIQSEEQNENTPFFIKPSGFRPNSLFVGREAQLAEMHKMLIDKKRRAQGTSAILIQCLPGGGKSHLAREYVYEHREDFPGGIFWLRAKSPAELANGFWDIARKAVLRHSVDKEDLAALRDPQQFIKIVRKWLNHRENWLLVLDGIHFTDDADALRKFIPDSKNTSLIYTSTEKSASGDHHFMNPQVIKLPNLSAREAQRLLLLEIDKKEPFSKEDSKYAMELVQAMGFLPVVIHAVAQRLKATEEPLSKFAKSYSNEPRLRGLGTYMAVVDQLKAHGSLEALNLIHVLCFFSQHIPVEMIALGLRALDVDVKATDPVTGHSLNTTFKHLNMFALIDRDHDHDHEETLQSSQSSKNTGDILADNVDVIRIHSVVQGFFIDTLSAAGTLPMWLDRAARVFCCSYDHANIRITKKTHAGLVEDYRLYEIHGIRLRGHLVRHSKKWPELGEAHRTLDQYLEAIQSEIERRTPESSQTIAGGRPDAFQTSIFDRTSSSSDAGPETPSDRLTSRVSTFGFEPEKSLLESPLSVTRDNEYTRLVEIREGHGAPHNHLQLPATEDNGYDSDREGSTAMTLQPSQQTLHPPETPIGSDGAWETVPPRRSKRPRGLDLHRTISRLEKSKYSDRAGSFRAMSAIDPRLSTENAHGYVQKPSSRAQSRGRMSGHSHAEVALTNITASSPPPARGGGKIVGRPSSGTREKSHFVAGSASYAAAVASSTKDTIPGFEEIIRQTIEPSRKPATSVSTLDSVSGSSALESLQRYPVEAHRHPAEPRILTLMPPYPPTPGTDPDVTYEQPFPDKALYHNRSSSQENLHLGPDPFSTNIYPRMPGTIPVETRDFSSSPLKRSLPHDYSAWHSQTYSDSMSASMYLPPHPQTQTSNQNPPYLSLSSPNMRRPHSNSSPRPSTYYPGHPELSFSSPPNQHDGGYTSQPMSRDPSGQSVGSTEQGRGRRRSSLADTEPLPQLPTFSPVILPTSYQVYERIQERKLLDEMMGSDKSHKTGGPVRKSPRLGNARAALIEKLDESDENLPAPRRQFHPNPTAPSFSPSPSRTPYSKSARTSPANLHSPFSPPRTLAQHSFSSISVSPISHPYSTPRSFTTLNQVQMEGQMEEQPQAPEMGRTGSGGVKIGNGQVIKFGDFPDKVDMREARERVERTWVTREGSSPMPLPLGVGLGIRRS